jgi:hypothetical protein
MPPLEIDGKVDPTEYETRIDGPASQITVHPAGGPVFVEVYYTFDGVALCFGVRRVRDDVKIRGLSIWIDPDRNGCELGDLILAAKPKDQLVTYGIFESPGAALPIAGTPPDPAIAGVQLCCRADGDTEVRLDLAKQYKNGLTPNPLPEEMHVHVTVQGEDAAGELVANFLKAAPIQTFTIGFE